MVTDIYGRELRIGDNVVFTSVPHRGHRNSLRTGKIEKISEKGKLSIRTHAPADLRDNYSWGGGQTIDATTIATGNVVTLNSSNRVIKW